jgi:glycosyltransferase involved in cell wall biosynthesis
VVLDYLLAARAFRRKTLVHVHEIPDGLKLQVFRRLLKWMRADVIFNSKAARAAYRLPARQTQHVVYNGIAVPPPAEPSHYDGARPLRLLMLGRISRIKGQDLLIEALALLPKAIAQRLEVRVVGNSFQNDIAREAGLREAVRVAGLDAVVRFEPFREDTAPLYRWADVVAVPSRLPESLGRVAIEAMAYGRPPLVARIGGLPEVVEDGVTGWVVPPNDANALARTIGDIVNEPDTWRGYGSAAQARFEATFAARGIARQFQGIVRQRFGAASDRRATIGLARV